MQFAFVATLALLLTVFSSRSSGTYAFAAPQQMPQQKPLWQHNITFSDSTGMSPIGPLCADEDMVYFLAWVPVQSGTAAFAYNLRTGRQVWRNTEMSDVSDIRHISSCSKKDGVVVFANDVYASMVVLHRLTGAKLWSHRAPTWVHQFIFGPAITTKGLVAVMGTPTNVSCILFSLKDGAMIWTNEDCVAPGEYHTPYSARIPSNDQYFFTSACEKQSDGTFTSYLYAYELETGKLGWKSVQVTGLDQGGAVMDINYQPHTHMVMTSIMADGGHIVGTNVTAPQPSAAAAFNLPFSPSMNMWATLIAPSPQTKYTYMLVSSTINPNDVVLVKGAPDGTVSVVLRNINSTQSIPYAEGGSNTMSPVVVPTPDGGDFVSFVTPQGVYGVHVTADGGEYKWWDPCLGGVNWYSMVMGSGIVVAPVSFTHTDASIAAFKAFP